MLLCLTWVGALHAAPGHAARLHCCCRRALPSPPTPLPTTTTTTRAGFDEFAATLAQVDSVSALTTLYTSLQGGRGGAEPRAGLVGGARQGRCSLSTAARPHAPPPATAAGPSAAPTRPGLALMLLVVRLMWSLTAQRRLSIITRTIAQARCMRWMNVCTNESAVLQLCRLVGPAV